MTYRGPAYGSMYVGSQAQRQRDTHSLGGYGEVLAVLAGGAIAGLLVGRLLRFLPAPSPRRSPRPRRFQEPQVLRVLSASRPLRFSGPQRPGHIELPDARKSTWGR